LHTNNRRDFIEERNIQEWPEKYRLAFFNGKRKDRGCVFYYSSLIYMVLQNDLCFLPRPFSKLQPAPVNYRAETPFQPDFDNTALRKYVHCQKIVRKPASDWYNQTSYKAAFDLPYFSAGKSSILCCTHYFFLGKRGIRQTKEVRSAISVNQFKLH
uniref:Uncharacterized protein n=1 Tax=Anas zonorhyncha TaxID=75864 RepID=A0A8B9URB3_9AVES